MKFATPLIILLTILVSTIAVDPQPAHAKAYFAPKKDMIIMSEAIAVVELDNVKKAEKKGTSWTYATEARARLIKSIKGALPPEFTVYGGENFICARTSLTPGKALVFLNHNGDLLISSNWHLGVRPITDGNLEWYDGDRFGPLKSVPLSTVIAYIESELGKRNMPVKSSLKAVMEAKYLDDSTVAEGGQESAWYKAFNEMRKKAPASKNDVDYMFKWATPAGKVYAAIILYKIDKEAGQRALAMLSTSNATVTCRSGCEVSTSRLCSVGSQLYTDRKFMGLNLD